MADKRSPDDPNVDPPRTEASEPEGGPFIRQKEFLEERMTPLRPKSDPDRPATRGTRDAPEIEKPEFRPGEEPVLPSGESPLDPDFRRKRIQEYRERQHQEIAGDTRPGTRGARDAAPPLPPDAPPANNWIAIGPSVLRQGQGGVKPATSGRTPAIAVAPGGTRLYIGSANGGVWVSEDTGTTWRSLMDSFDLNPTTIASDSLSCGAIALVAGGAPATDRVYVGSGEGAGGAYFGVGPIVSFDGGANWVTEPVAPGNPQLAGSAFHALAVDPADPDRVVAATYRGTYRREPNGAGGFHWAQKTMGGAGTQLVTSVVVARSGGVTTFYAARQNGPVYSSTDGHTWSVVGAGFPAGAQRVCLAVAATHPEVVYALVQSGDIYRFATADGTWRLISGIPAGFVGSQGWYDLALAVAPDNVNRIYIGGSTVLSAGDWSGSLYRCEITVGGGGAVSAVSTYIGGSVHADIHAIVFAPGDANKLWVGCDGGVYYTTTPTGAGNIFTSKNTGLATMTMNYLGQHPTEDAVLFCGTQDNGGVRFTGEEAWLYSSGGDGGFAVIHWQDPYKVLSTYVYGSVRRSTNGGVRYAYSSVNVPLAGDAVFFYAPIEGTPPNLAAPAEADIVAFGSVRPWISTTFGTSWQSIPNNTLAGDSLDGRIKSLCFASGTKLYAGTEAGGVYRFDKVGANWTRTQIDTVGGANALPLAGVITDIVVDPSDATGNSIYISFGGSGDFRHVWRFNGASWQQRSGPSAGHLSSLLDIQHNALAIDPANPTHLYVGADIGIWRSTDGGATWSVFSQGLPDAAVLDLKLHPARRLLRAATHGRGVFERTLDTLPKQGVELYVRDTQLDQGRFTTVNGRPDPTIQGDLVFHWRGPDIRLDTPDAMGNYQFPLGGNIDFHQFVDTLSDDFQNVATHATVNILTRVYVQVHNRGVLPANNVRVMLMLANASAGLPNLPAGVPAAIQTATPITTPNWRTLGFATLDDVRPGHPKVAAFDLPSTLLPPPASLAGNDHHCVLALLHHADDPFTNVQTHTDTLSLTERKAAHKNLKVVQFLGTLPSMPITMPVRIHNAHLERVLRTDLVIRLGGYPGRVRLFIPEMKLAGRIEEQVRGARVGQDFDDLKKFAGLQAEEIRRSQSSRHPYDKEFSQQRLEDIERAFGSGLMLDIVDTKQFTLRGIEMEPASRHTVFLMFDRPPNGQPGEFHEVEILQMEKREVIGGLSARVEVVPEPKREVYTLALKTRQLQKYTEIQALLADAAGKRLTPDDGAAVDLMLFVGDGPARELGAMSYQKRSRAFLYRHRFDTATPEVVTATALVRGVKVKEEKLPPM